MEQNNREEIEIDLKQIVFVLLDKALIIIMCAILAGVVGFAVTKLFMDPVYESVAKSFVVQNTDNSEVDANDFVTGNYLSKNYVEIVQSRTVFEEVIDALDLKMSLNDLKKKVTVEAITDTQMIKITVTDTDPYKAQELADAIRQVSEKELERILHVPEVEWVEEASLPMEPTGPSVVKNTFIGAIIGIFMAVAVIVIKFIMDDTIKSPEDIERYLGMSTLASIPVMEESEYDGERRSTKKNTRKNIHGNTSKKPRREAVR